MLWEVWDKPYLKKGAEWSCSVSPICDRGGLVVWSSAQFSWWDLSTYLMVGIGTIVAFTLVFWDLA